jgi:hypothetical protein
VTATVAGRPAPTPAPAPVSTVGDLLAAQLGRPVTVAHLERSASPFASRVPAEVVTVTLTGGETCRLFRKSLGDEEIDHPDKRCRDRELRVYRDLFAGRRLPVPSWVGGGWDGTTGRHELYLEYVDGWDLRYRHLDHWYLAAARLAGLHRTFARARGDLDRDFLLRIDLPYVHAWAQRARDALRRHSIRLARRYEPVLAATSSWGGLLAAQPATLVHNDLSGKNVLVDRSAGQPRVCLADWELAGVGCGLLDLVHLAYGLDAVPARRLRASYYRAVRGSDLLPRTRQALTALLAACAIHETNVRLGCSPRWSLPPRRLAEWVDDARAALQRVR